MLVIGKGRSLGLRAKRFGPSLRDVQGSPPDCLD